MPGAEMLGYLTAEPPSPSTWKPEQGEPLITTGKRLDTSILELKNITIAGVSEAVKPEVGKGLLVTNILLQPRARPPAGLKSRTLAHSRLTPQ